MIPFKNRLSGLLALIVLTLLVAAALPATAQDNPIYVCRDPRFTWIRLEFHNIPQDWLTWGGTSWGYEAEGVGGYGDILVADALTQDTDGYLAGTATIYEGDGSTFKLTGDANSTLCDPALSPVQDDGLQIVLTPAPTQDPTPVAQDAASCAYSTINGFTGKRYCYVPLDRGVVPVPSYVK